MGNCCSVRSRKLLLCFGPGTPNPKASRGGFHASGINGRSILVRNSLGHLQGGNNIIATFTFKLSIYKVGTEDRETS